MQGFNSLVAAKIWVEGSGKPAGQCSLIVHSDPYLCYQMDDFWLLERKYPNNFYLRGKTEVLYGV